MAERVLHAEAIDDPDTFVRRGGEWLARHSFDANVIGSNLAMARTIDPADRPDNLWFLVRGDAGRVVGVAMHTAGMPVFLPELPPGAAEAVAESAFRSNRRPPGANGDPEAARAFCIAWQTLTGVGWEQVDASILYVLVNLDPPTGVPGGLRLATADDVDELSEWTRAFVAEAEPPGMPVDPRDITTRRIAAEQILLWSVDGEAVSMAAITPVTGGAARVNLVYTPPHQRGRGYGSAVSAGATRTALERGADVCMLYADVANPISNAVYQRIGYREHSQAVGLRFRT
jgi:RimJ/RimL family protein N-acetyltransferase